MARRDRLAALPAHRAAGGGSPLKGPQRLDGAIDSHCHLQHESFDADRDDVIARAVDAGITRILVPGYDARSSARAIDLASRHPDLIDAAVGVHPHHAGDAMAADWDEIDGLAGERGVVAIGEIGLDFHRNLSSAGAQRDGLARQLALAAARGLPVVVHDRDAHTEVTAALLGWGGRRDATARGVLHCFSGDRAMAKTLTAGGFLVSFALPVTFSSGREQLHAAADAPGGAYLTETDAPWLGPGSDRRNEPTTVVRVAAALARARGTTTDAIARDVALAYAALVSR
ncbi:MAG: TatD family hydrolase [Candidatus Limnocylindria bacterium]